MASIPPADAPNATTSKVIPGNGGRASVAGDFDIDSLPKESQRHYRIGKGDQSKLHGTLSLRLPDFAGLQAYAGFRAVMSAPSVQADVR
jgi:hypothetical protein